MATQYLLDQYDIITTTNNNSQTVLAYTVGSNISGSTNVEVICRRLSDGATKCWSLRATYKRNTGSLTVTEAATNLPVLGTTGDLTSLLLANVSIQANGNDMIIVVYPLNTDMVWLVSQSIRNLVL